MILFVHEVKRGPCSVGQPSQCWLISYHPKYPKKRRKERKKEGCVGRTKMDMDSKHADIQFSIRYSKDAGKVVGFVALYAGEPSYLVVEHELFGAFILTLMIDFQSNTRGRRLQDKSTAHVQSGPLLAALTLIRPFFFKGAVLSPPSFSAPLLDACSSCLLLETRQLLYCRYVRTSYHSIVIHLARQKTGKKNRSTVYYKTVNFNSNSKKKRRKKKGFPKADGRYRVLT